jgi:hypothetical protein
MRYQLAVNETARSAGPLETDGEVLAADTGEWALFQRPPTNTRFRHSEPVSFERHSEVVGPGATGEWLVYLGPQTTYERTAHGQRVRLVVPEAATLREPAPEIVNAMVAASEALPIGDRDEAVFMVAAPDREVSWAVRGLEVGDADMWVRADEPLDHADNAWLHEYVHTRQRFNLAQDMQWFREASASYLATLVTYEQGRIDGEAFRTQLAAGATPRYDAVVLGEPDTWTGFTGYDKGALVLGALDRRIRVGPRNESILPVIARLNERREPVDAVTFRNQVRAVGGEPVAQRSTRAVRTAYNGTVWGPDDHRPAFGPPGTQAQFRMPPPTESNGFRIAGPYRLQSVDRLEAAQLVPGERLIVIGEVSNPGERATSFNASLWVDGRASASSSGTIQPGRTKSMVISHEFDTPGRYQVTLGNRTGTVEVIDPAAAEVGAVSVDQRQFTVGDRIRLSAVLQNSAERPAVGEIRVRRNDRFVGAESELLAPNSSSVVSVRLGLPSSGVVNLTINGKQALRLEVAGNVTATTPPAAGTDTTGGGTPQRAPTGDRPGAPAWQWVAIAATVLAVTGLLVALRRHHG